MRLFRTGSPTQMAAALTLLRLMLGIVYIAHGGQKAFTMGIPAVSGMFGKMGIPAPGVAGAFIPWLEMIGGALLILGLLTRVVAVLLACDMIGAMAFVHLRNGFFLPMGYEFVLLLCVIDVTLLLTGAGPWSVDGLIARRGSEAG
jgi:putative oxidoreductase